MVLAVAVLWAVVASARAYIHAAFDIPTVQTSYLTKQCIEVTNHDGTKGDCKHLPDRYHNVWVY